MFLEKPPFLEVQEMLMLTYIEYNIRINGKANE